MSGRGVSITWWSLMDEVACQGAQVWSGLRGHDWGVEGGGD